MLRKLKNLGHLCLAVLANILYGFPGRNIKIIGVTGTDGKTTTTSLIYHILNASGRKAAMITTIGANIGGETFDTGFHVTTPSSFALQKFLSRAVQKGQEFAVIETSSHGIDQNRIWGINFLVAVITNITHEHLDYHPSFEHYAKTKMHFLAKARTAIVNNDDTNIKSHLDILKNKLVTYSLSNKGYINPENFPFQTKLFGSFNQANCLAAIAVCKTLGLSDDEIREGLKSFVAPLGRQDIVHDHSFKVMVDFAHTPNSVENILREVKNTNPKKVIHVFGAPGRRDETKRPLMGQASDKYADVIILTADDPRDEKVSDINNQIKQGISNKFKVGVNLFELQDRKDAIKFALSQAQTGDFVVLTGKGHEPTLALQNQEIPWNEKEVVLTLLNK